MWCYIFHTLVCWSSIVLCSKWGLFPDLCMHYSPSVELKNSSNSSCRLPVYNIQLLCCIGNYTLPQVHSLWISSREDLQAGTTITSQSFGHIAALPSGQMVRVGVSIWEPLVFSNKHLSAFGYPRWVQDFICYWDLKQYDLMSLGEAPPDYAVFSSPRDSGYGGGVATIFRNLKIELKSY